MNVLNYLHDMNGHLGITKTLELTRKRFYWPSLRDDLKRYVNKCADCAKKKDINTTNKLPMVKVNANELLPFEKIGIDILGPLPTTDNGNKYILVLQDYFTKWMDAKAVKSIESSVIIDWLVKFISTHGVPKSIVCDNGTQLDCKEFKDFCANDGIEIFYTTPFHHQSNGMVERLNRSLLNMLRVYVDENQKKWDLYIYPSLLAYRTAVHEVTKKSPLK